MGIELLLQMAVDGMGDRVLIGRRQDGITPRQLLTMARRGADAVVAAEADAVIYVAGNGHPPRRSGSSCRCDRAALGPLRGDSRRGAPTRRGGSRDRRRHADSRFGQSAVARVVDEYGRLDVLVNNAAIARLGDIATLTRADWDATFAVNLTAVMELCQAAVPALSVRGGSIVNVSSFASMRGGCGSAAYAASKAGLEA
jgi:NAD(P)-dependent dehydrogenase (short-subunit alcohol dehydrogenase family)